MHRLFFGCDTSRCDTSRRQVVDQDQKSIEFCCCVWRKLHLSFDNVVLSSTNPATTVGLQSSLLRPWPAFKISLCLAFFPLHQASQFKHNFPYADQTLRQLSTSYDKDFPRFRSSTEALTWVTRGVPMPPGRSTYLKTRIRTLDYFLTN